MSAFCKKLSLCLAAMFCVLFLNSCESSEKKDVEIARHTFQKIELCVNSKDAIGFKRLFSSASMSALEDTDIEKVLFTFPSGITAYETPYDDSLSVVDWVEGGDYGKTIEWSREVICNETGERYVVTVLQQASNWRAENTGITRLVIYPIGEENDFLNWWASLEDYERPYGIIQYKKYG